MARIAEDEDEARTVAGWDLDGRTRANGQWSRAGIASVEDGERRSVIYSDAGQVSGEVADHIARHDPARVLAECEAKRRIVEWASDGEGEFHWSTVLAPLAAVYADHPDYREEWS